MQDGKNKIKSKRIVWHNTHVLRCEREEILSQQGCTIWLTGLPSSGKSTTAFSLEHELIRRNYLAYVLDGDNVRHGLNGDLGFCANDRSENIRRVGEVAKLIADAGIITITSLISPYRQERDLARNIHQEAKIAFIEIFINTPLEVCEQRDPKGLYKKARVGEMKDFTGINAPYEAPLHPELILRTHERSPDEIAFQIMSFMFKNGYLKPNPQKHLALAKRI